MDVYSGISGPPLISVEKQRDVPVSVKLFSILCCSSMICAAETLGHRVLFTAEHAIDTHAHNSSLLDELCQILELDRLAHERVEATTECLSTSGV